MRILFSLIILYWFEYVVTENVHDDIFKSRSISNSIIQNLAMSLQNNYTTHPIFVNYQSTNNGRPRRHVKHRKFGRGSYFPTYGNRRHLRGKCRRKIRNIHAKCRKSKRDDRRAYENSAEWDNWSKWTKCSATCGDGRRTRWRHCSGEDCPKEGLKRAQIKPCNLKPCSKGLLSWLGLKHKQKKNTK